MKKLKLTAIAGAGCALIVSPAMAANDVAVSVDHSRIPPSYVSQDSVMADGFKVAYTVKYICGTADPSTDLGQPFSSLEVAPGTYTTSINTMNPSVATGANDSVSVSAVVRQTVGNFTLNQQFDLRSEEVLDGGDVDLISCSDIILNLIGGVLPDDLPAFASTFQTDHFSEGYVTIVIDEIESGGVLTTFIDNPGGADRLSVDAIYTVETIGEDKPK